MMKGIYFAYVIVTLAYFPVATAGYAAFGNQVNADVLLSVSRPAGLIEVANFMVVIHIAASYQVHPLLHSLSSIDMKDASSNENCTCHVTIVMMQTWTHSCIAT